MCVLAPIHAHNINSSLSLSQWLYKDSGSRNTIYASLARYIMCVQAPFHAHNINSLAISLSLSMAFRLSEHYICQLSSFSLSQWLYKDSGSRNTIYASLARYIMCVQAPFHTHNINSLASLSLSLPLWFW